MDPGEVNQPKGMYMFIKKTINMSIARFEFFFFNKNSNKAIKETPKEEKTFIRGLSFIRLTRPDKKLPNPVKIIILVAIIFFKSKTMIYQSSLYP